MLGLRARQGGEESAKFWMHVLTDLKNCSVADVFFVSTPMTIWYCSIWCALGLG